MLRSILKRLSAADRTQLFGPLALMVVTTLLSYPLRVFTALCTGLQDAVFAGVMSVGQLLVSNFLIVVLTLKGFGLYGVAFIVRHPTLGMLVTVCA